MERRTTDKPYSREVIDLKFDEVHERFDQQDTTLGEIKQMVGYTNGKVKKIIMAIALVVGAAVGFGGKELIPVLLKLIV